MSSPISTGSDRYAWKNAGGGAWNDAANWQDLTTGANPAAAAPGAGNPVWIVGATYSASGPSFLTVTGGGASASLEVTGPSDQLGYVALRGAYSSGSVIARQGVLSVAGAGSSLTAAGPVTIGTVRTGPGGPSGYGGFTVQDGAAVTALGDVTVNSGGSIGASGAGSRLVVAGTATLADPLDAMVGGSGPTISANDGGAIQVAGLDVRDLDVRDLAGNIYGSSIFIAPDSSIEVGTDGGAAAGTLTVDAGRTVNLAGGVSIAFGGNPFTRPSPGTKVLVVDDGTINLSGGITTVNGDVSGGGRWNIGPGGTLAVNGTVAAGGTIAFTGGGTLQIGAGGGTPHAMNATLSEFGAGDSITSPGVRATRASYTATGAGLGTLGLFDGDRLVTSFTLAGSYTGRTFTVAPVPATFTSGEGSTVTVAPTATASIAALDADEPEGQTGTTALTFTVTRTGDLSAPGTLAYAVAGRGDLPAAADDFVGGVSPTGTVAFAEGESSKTITVAARGDTEREGDEAFTVTLSVLNGDTGLGVASALGFIRNDDGRTVVVPADGTTLPAEPGDRLYIGTTDADVLTAATTARGTATSLASNGDVVLARDGGTDLLRGVERVDFVDGRLVFDPGDPVAQVARLYQAGLGRQPDVEGLSYWTERLRHGAYLDQIATGFMDSPEFTSRFGQGGSDADFVNAVYLNVLGRAPDAAGQSYWIEQLRAGGGRRADVLVGISQSEENRRVTAPLVQGGVWELDSGAAQAARMYDTVFGRLPDTAGLAFWTRHIDSGELTLEVMAGQFIGTPEFQAAYGTLSDRDFVRATYGNSLHRPGDQAGVDYWTARLEGGATRAQVVAGFSESPEHRALTAPDILGDAPSAFGIATV